MRKAQLSAPGDLVCFDPHVTATKVADFEQWARATLAAGTDSLVDRLPAGIEPKAGGEGGPRTTEAGYRSSFVRAISSRLGRFAVWLYAAPPRHAYNPAPRHRLGIGILDDELRALPRQTVAPPLGAGTQIIRWQKLSNDWASHVGFIDAEHEVEPEVMGAALAERAHQGLRRLGLLG